MRVSSTGWPAQKYTSTLLSSQSGLSFFLLTLRMYVFFTLSFTCN